MAPGLINDGWH